MKHCKDCNTQKDSTEFYGKVNHQANWVGLSASCKVCVRSRRKLYVLNNPNKVKHQELMQTFGITLEHYNSMFVAQEGKCLICLKHATEFSRALCVDHCHATGRIRGLLCSKCNSALGLFNDSEETMLNAVKYLKGQ